MSTRPVGLTKDAGYQIGVSRTFACTIDHAWDVVSDRGRSLWLGEVPDLEPNAGVSYETTDGVSGELRSWRPLDRIRMTWQSPELEHESTVQVALSTPVSSTPTDPRTVVRFHQDRLTSTAEREQQRAHWAAVMDELTPLLDPST